ncbi:phosphoribosylanthranilate isomerase [Vagococcus acidifermentans]|uniref:N-(5'-phosphoribosyl)anthranilate isomerase n=1 Tax=Vagococcus acidifermentans TaxID=564710 RepID=A0A430AM83_9ENTE|nr:phosphoribosylanthranilate isomerase [Vagococcus acidifermentans]RSU09242.1 hypothetical protein CBF27_13170 [Vagococcus acidifermentans]
MTKVKICGLTDERTVDGAVAAGVDYIGFVFAESRRRITAEHAATISKHVPKTVKKVGVFVSPSKKVLLETIDTVPLDLIQVHGTFQRTDIPGYCSLIQAINGAQTGLVSRIKKSCGDYLLLDAPAGNQPYAGGNGKTFDWSVTTEQQHQLSRRKFFVAGGLDETNVARAIRIFKPYGVDVSSGVETDGKKDIKKIQRFIQRVKEEKNV